LPPLLLTALGFAVGGLLGLAVVAARGRLGLLRQPPLVWAHGVGGLAGYHALHFAALALAPPVEANLLNYTWPVLIVLLSGPVLGLPLGLPLGPRRLGAWRWRRRGWRCCWPGRPRRPARRRLGPRRRHRRRRHLGAVFGAGAPPGRGADRGGGRLLPGLGRARRGGAPGA